MKKFQIISSLIAVLIIGLMGCSKKQYFSFNLKKSEKHNSEKLVAEKMATDFLQEEQKIKNSTSIAQNELVSNDEDVIMHVGQQTPSFHEISKTVEQVKGRKLSRVEKIVAKKLERKVMSTPGKSQVVAAVLCWFLGVIGVHRFYLGYTTIGIIQIFTFGGCGIWALIDLIRILTGELKPIDGEYETTLEDI